MTTTSSAHLTCLCGDISEPGTLISNPEIPMNLEICHCNPCRRTTGSLGVAFPTLNSSPSQDTLSKLTAYHSSQNTIRYFCSTCGSHCFVVNYPNKEWYCLGGIVEQSPKSKATNTTWPEDIIKVSRHDFVLDTVDGGLVPLMLNLNGRSIPTWSAASQERSSFDLPHTTVLSLPSKSTNTLPSPKEGSYLPAKCHCGGVSLLIKRANYTADSNPEALTSHISLDPTKYPTSMCACRSCRLSTGVSLVPWALTLQANIFHANAQSPSGDQLVPVIFGRATSRPDANQGLSLKQYWSSQGVCWSFCGKCGATVSYFNSQRPKEVDLAVGILRAEEGSMAKRWLDWEWGRCSFAEESIDKEVCEAWLGCEEVMKKIGG